MTRLLNPILFFLMVAVFSMNPQQAYIAHQIMKARNTPAWSAIIDASLSDQVAFTEQDKFKVYIDADRLRNTPHTFQNVVQHECTHLLGGQHGDGGIGMSYVLSENADGTIVDDSFLLMPEINLLGPR